MKNNLQKMFTIAAFCLIFGCAASIFGQIKTGGYKSISVENEGVLAAVDFAIAKKSEEMEVELSLQAIEKAEIQVVAGTNYRLCLQIYAPAKEEETDGVTLFIKTVIYKNLKGEYSITSWEDEECAENK